MNELHGLMVSPVESSNASNETVRIGLGCMGLSGMYGEVDSQVGVRVIQGAIERGVSFIDTGDFYGMGDNEMLIARAIVGRRERATLSVKFGLLRGPDGTILGYDTRPAAVKTWCAYSLKRLGVDVIDVYRPSRLDPTVPIEDTIGAIAELVHAGYVKRIGLSEVGVETIRRAAKVHAIADLQIEHSLASRKPEDAIFPALRVLGIGATLYGVYSRGLLTGRRPAGQRDFRAHLPRFNASQNEEVVTTIAAFSRERGLTPAQTLLGWTLARSPDFLPVIGVKNLEQLDEALSSRALPNDDVTELERLVPRDRVVGSRYGDAQMKQLDSER
jgi:aryl-alcohol dehydrogenase-like predicted oxidoreductase